MPDKSGFGLIGLEDAPVAAQAKALLAQLEQADFDAQFWGQKGRVAELGQENGLAKMDWVNGLAQILSHPQQLEVLLTEAATILADPAIKHIVWSGMGGSVMTLHTLQDLGLLENARFKLHILDSTDPAQLNQLLQNIAQDEGLSLDEAHLPPLLAQMFMIGVSMGMTSEEPITHLRWFTSLLTAHQLKPAQHLRVLTLPDSYLHKFADEFGVTRLNLQLDGGSDTPGRMSAPTTKVFLLPVALQLLAHANGNLPEAKTNLQNLLQIGQNLYQANAWEGLEPHFANPKLVADPFVQLGAVIAAQTQQGHNQIILGSENNEWRPLYGWVEQLVEESLGKGGKGFLIFYDQQFADDTPDLTLLNIGDAPIPKPSSVLNLTLTLPTIPTTLAPVLAKLAFVTGFFANFKKTIVTFAWLENIVWAGQPAVEAYKRFARQIRDGQDAILLPSFGPNVAAFRSLRLDYNPVIKTNLISQLELKAEMSQGGLAQENERAAQIYALILDTARQNGRLNYADLTFNGEASPALTAILEETRRILFNQWLQVAVKIRHAPQDYHSTEQSETDGPPGLVSLRIVAATHKPILFGEYTDRFLLAQTLGTVAAMQEAGREVLLLVLPDLGQQSLEDLRKFFQAVSSQF